MIAPEEAVRLARARRAKGGATWLPLPDAAMYARIPVNTVYQWANLRRVSRQNGHVDLGEVLEVRDASSVRVPGLPLTYRVLAYFRLLANGLQANEIAEQYGVGKYAVHNAIHYGAHALGARSRTHAVALLVARGVISAQEVHGASIPIMDKLQGDRSA
ncbi:hypothetical protein [Streptomyces mirabilis]|uniref:hypothetical protein n=1 Tax=Streptomyces mirabilis TaxID=68239 RepID=UPI00367D240A